MTVFQFPAHAGSSSEVGSNREVEKGEGGLVMLGLTGKESRQILYGRTYTRYRVSWE